MTFEYVMLKGVNDSPAEAKALVQLLKGVPAKINLIPFNPWPGSPYECSDWGTIEAFAAILNRGGYASPIRTPRGRDILAACGQLKSESEKVRASVRRKAAAGERGDLSALSAGGPAHAIEGAVHGSRAVHDHSPPVAGDPGLRHRLPGHPAARRR